MRSFENQRRGVNDFVGVHAGDGASGHVACNVAASACRIQSDLPEAVEHFRQRFDGDPVQLNVLANAEVGDSVGVLAGEIGDGAQLAGSHHAVGNADAHHETLQCAANSALTAGYAGAVTLGIYAPPAEIGADPFGWDG